MYDELIDALRCAYAYVAKTGENPYRFVAYYKQAADAIEELSAIREEQKAQIILMAAEIEEQQPLWIPVSERLPKEPGMYIVFLRCGAELQDPGFPDDLSYVTAMHFDFDQRIWNDGVESYNANLDVVNKPHAYYVTHWQPLPEPPKEET